MDEMENKVSNPEPEDMLYDDYFTDEDDPGVKAVIEHKGKLLEFRLKKSLTLDEKQLASDAAVGIELDKDGNPHITKMDQAAYTKAIVFAGVLGWPFKYSNHPKIAANLRGKPVPITKYHVSRMDGVLAEKVANIILGQQGAQQKAIDPFAQKSGAASSAADRHNQD